MTSPGTEGVTKQQSSKQHYYSPHKRQNFHHPSEVFLVSVCQKTTKQKKHTMKNCKKKNACAGQTFRHAAEKVG